VPTHPGGHLVRRAAIATVRSRGASRCGQYAPIEHTFAKPASLSSRTPATANPWPAVRRSLGLPVWNTGIGGLEAANGSGNISYEPKNHDLMCGCAKAKIDGITVPNLEVDDPTGDAELLLVGWGSSYGPIGEACRRARRKGIRSGPRARAHLNPFPANLGDVLKRYPGGCGRR